MIRDSLMRCSRARPWRVLATRNRRTASWRSSSATGMQPSASPPHPNSDWPSQSSAANTAWAGVLTWPTARDRWCYRSGRADKSTPVIRQTPSMQSACTWAYSSEGACVRTDTPSAAYTPDDGHVDASGATHALAKAARSNGVDIMVPGVVGFLL